MILAQRLQNNFFITLGNDELYLCEEFEICALYMYLCK